MRTILVGMTGTVLATLVGSCGASPSSRSHDNTAAGRASAGVTADGASGGTASPATVTAQVDDPVFGMPQMSIAVPAGWSSKGTVLRTPCDDLPIPVLRANALDGATGIQLFPRFIYVWSDMPGMEAEVRQKGCTFGRAASPADFVRGTLIPQARPGASIVSVDAVPNDTTPQQIASTNAQFAAQAAEFNRASGGDAPVPQATGESRSVRIRYPSNGRTVDESLQVTVVSQDLPQLNPMGSPRYFHLVTTQVTVVGARAPSTGFDAAQPMFAAIAKSIAPNPAWQQRENAEQQRLAQQQIAQSQAQNAEIQRLHDDTMAQITARTQQSIDNIHAIGGASMASAARMEAARHTGAQAFVQHIGDRQTVMDPGTGRTAEVSNQYNHTYYDPQAGRVIQTNSANNPGANWTELQVVPPR